MSPGDWIPAALKNPLTEVGPIMKSFVLATALRPAKVEIMRERSIEGQIPVAPEGFYLFGEIWLDSYKGYPHRTIIPVKLFTGLDD